MRGPPCGECILDEGNEESIGSCAAFAVKARSPSGSSLDSDLAPWSDGSSGVSCPSVDSAIG
jgi:hypothetical protein